VFVVVLMRTLTTGGTMSTGAEVGMRLCLEDI